MSRALCSACRRTTRAGRFCRRRLVGRNGEPRRVFDNSFAKKISGERVRRKELEWRTSGSSTEAAMSGRNHVTCGAASRTTLDASSVRALAPSSSNTGRGTTSLRRAQRGDLRKRLTPPKTTAKGMPRNCRSPQARRDLSGELRVGARSAPARPANELGVGGEPMRIGSKRRPFFRAVWHNPTVLALQQVRDRLLLDGVGVRYPPPRWRAGAAG
jgi:hypothetical protein